MFTKAEANRFAPGIIWLMVLVIFFVAKCSLLPIVPTN